MSTSGRPAGLKPTRGNRSQYASIGAVINNVKQANAFGLTFTQEVDFEGDTMFVRTVMMHTSGEARISRYPIYVDDNTNSQKIGGAITYAKRYALANVRHRERRGRFRTTMMTVKRLADDAPKHVPPKPAATASDSVSPSDDAGHPAGGGLQPVASPLFDLIVNAPDDRLEELLEKADLKVLQQAFKKRGGTKEQSEEVVKMFGNRKREIVNG